MTPLNGGKWDDLQACITQVLTCKPRMLGRLNVRHHHTENINVVQKSAFLNAARKNDGAEGSLAAQETLNAARPYAKHSHGRNKKHSAKEHAGPSHASTQKRKGPCHSCGEVGHLRSECPHPSTTPAPRKCPYQPQTYHEPQHPPASSYSHGMDYPPWARATRAGVAGAGTRMVVVAVATTRELPLGLWHKALKGTGSTL